MGAHILASRTWPVVKWFVCFQLVKAEEVVGIWLHLHILMYISQWCILSMASGGVTLPRWCFHIGLLPINHAGLEGS